MSYEYYLQMEEQEVATEETDLKEASFLLTEKVPKEGETIMYECNHGFTEGEFMYIIDAENGIGEVWLPGGGKDRFDRWFPINCA